jgi:hypothetical protein
MRIKLLVVLACGVVAGLAGASTPATAATKCVDVIQGGDIGERICIDEADCLVARYHTTFLGTERTCVVPRPTGARTSVAARCVATYAVTGKTGSKYCVDSEGSCLVFSYQTSPLGTAYYCHVRRP